MLTSKVHTIIRILSLSGLLALFGCAREAATPARIPQASDSLYTAKAAMRIYGTQPERALTSSISMLEVIVVFVLIWILGCLCSLSMGPLSNWKVLGKTILFLIRFVAPAALLAIAIFQIHE